MRKHQEEETAQAEMQTLQLSSSRRSSIKTVLLRTREFEEEGKQNIKIKMVSCQFKKQNKADGMV